MSYLDSLLNALSWFFNIIVQALSWLLDGLLYVLMGFIYLTVSGMLTGVYSVIAAISFSSVVFQWSAGWAGLSQGTIYLVTSLKLPEFVFLVSTATVVRKLLDLIPGLFTRI